MAPAPVQPDSPHGRPARTAAWLLLAPLLLWLGLFVVAPLAIMLVYSVGRPGELGGVVLDDLTLEPYAEVFNRPLLAAVGLAALLGAGLAGLAGSLALSTVAALPRLEHLWERFGRAFLLCCFFGSGWLGVTYLVSILPSANYVRIFVLSINYALLSTLICVIVAYPVGYFMGRASERVRNLLMVAIMVPFWTSFLIRTYAWLSILKGEGVMNDFLLWAKIVSQPMEILYTPTAVMIGLVYTYLPFMILPIYTSCEKLDQSLIDAAFDLGAGPWRAFWTVILPLTWPGVVAGLIITFVPAIGMFAVNDILGGKTEPLIGNVITNQFLQARNWPRGAALGMVLMAIFVVLYFVAMRKKTSVVG